MLDYLAYLWARDITEETVGARRRLLSEILEVEERGSGRGRARPARTAPTRGQRIASVLGSRTGARRYS